jgi:hypothetical protein
LNTSLQNVLALIDEAFAGTQRDESCTIHQAQLADETLDREIPDEEWLVAKRRDPEINWRDVPATAGATKKLPRFPGIRKRLFYKGDLAQSVQSIMGATDTFPPEVSGLASIWNPFKCRWARAATPFP